MPLRAASCGEIQDGSCQTVAIEVGLALRGLAASRTVKPFSERRTHNSRMRRLRLLYRALSSRGCQDRRKIDVLATPVLATDFNRGLGLVYKLSIRPVSVRAEFCQCRPDRADLLELAPNNSSAGPQSFRLVS